MSRKSGHRRLPRIPKSRHVEVTRAEFNAAIDAINKRGDIVLEGIEELRRSLDTQFKRIAQLQLEIDALKRVKG